MSLCYSWRIEPVIWHKMLLQSFILPGDQAALEQQAVPHPNQSKSLNNIVTALMTLFDQSGQCEDLSRPSNPLRSTWVVPCTPSPLIQLTQQPCGWC